MSEENNGGNSSRSQQQRENDIEITKLSMQVQSLRADIGTMQSLLQQFTSQLNKFLLLEQAQAQIDRTQERTQEVVNNLESRVTQLEVAAALSKRTDGFVDKVTWLVMGGVIAAVLSLVIRR